jgi:ribosome-associated toxin RatA of RatAB toxin-antitoxin module
MKNRRRTAMISILVVLGAAACSVEDSKTPAHERSGVAERHGDRSAAAPPASGEARGERIPVAGSDLTRGRGTVLVDAPIDRVRKHVLDFDHYADFMPHYEVSRTLGKKEDGTRELYMKVAVLHGLLSMWARLAMSPAQKDGDSETYAFRFLDGNVESFEGSWRLRSLDDARTELTLELFLEPKLPLPAGALNDENASGAVDGVTAMRDRIQAAN